MSELDDLLPLYRDNDHTHIRFVGGPGDGRSMTWATGEPPTSIRLPVEQEWPPIGVPQEPKLDLTQPPNALYYLARDERGYPSRADDGALLYAYHSTA